MADDPELQVLLHESTQLHQSIERISGRILGLLGVALPGALALFGYLAGSKGSSAIASVAFAGVVALVTAYACSLWTELLTYIEYKYGVLYPALYSKAGREAQNMMHFLAQRPSLVPAMIFMFLIFALTFGLACWGIRSETSILIWLAVLGLLICPLLSIIIVIRRVLALYKTFATRAGGSASGT